MTKQEIVRKQINELKEMVLAWVPSSRTIPDCKRQEELGKAQLRGMARMAIMLGYFTNDEFELIEAQIEHAEICG